MELGTVELEDFTDSAGTTAFSADSGDAAKRNVTVGCPVGNSWSVDLGDHVIDAETDLEVDGVVAGPFDLSGSLLSVGLQLMFQWATGQART